MVSSYVCIIEVQLRSTIKKYNRQYFLFQLKLVILSFRRLIAISVWANGNDERTWWLYGRIYKHILKDVMPVQVYVRADLKPCKYLSTTQSSNKKVTKAIIIAQFTYKLLETLDFLPLFLFSVIRFVYELRFQSMLAVVSATHSPFIVNCFVLTTN